MPIPNATSPRSWDKQREAMLDHVFDARTLLDREYHPHGYNIGVNVGRAAGQTIMHAHIHLIPRRLGDVADPRGGVRGVIPGGRVYSVPWRNDEPIAVADNSARVAKMRTNVRVKGLLREGVKCRGSS